MQDMMKGKSLTTLDKGRSLNVRFWNVVCVPLFFIQFVVVIFLDAHIKTFFVLFPFLFQMPLKVCNLSLGCWLRSSKGALPVTPTAT
jgi:hypothetical protein